MNPLLSESAGKLPREKQIADKAALASTLMSIYFSCGRVLLMPPAGPRRRHYRRRSQYTASASGRPESLTCRPGQAFSVRKDPAASSFARWVAPLYRLDQGYPQPAFFQLQDAVDSAACRRGDSVLQQCRVVSGFQHHARGAVRCLRGQQRGHIARNPTFTPASASASMMM